MVRFEKMYTWMKGRSEARFQRNAKSYTGNKEQFKEGDKVWCYMPHKLERKSGKITDAWLGPYNIIRIVSDVMLKVTPSLTEGRAMTIHRAKVRRYYPPQYEEKYRPPAEPYGDDMGDEMDEEIGGPA